MYSAQGFSVATLGLHLPSTMLRNPEIKRASEIDRIVVQDSYDVWATQDEDGCGRLSIPDL